MIQDINGFELLYCSYGTFLISNLTPRFGLDFCNMIFPFKNVSL